METAILQGVRNVLFDVQLEIFNVHISEPEIFKFADVETELHNHHLETGNPQLHICISEVHLIVAAIADKEIVNRQMLDSNPFICCFISIE